MAPKDELLTRLLAQADRIESRLAGLAEQIAANEKAVEARLTALEGAIRQTAAHDARIAALEATEQRAQGAAWASKAIFGAIVALVGVAGAIVGRTTAPERPSVTVAAPSR